jgi:hypothetical protein
MDADNIKAIVEEAVVTLYAEEATILEFDVGERTVCACLAAILKRSFDQHSVHVEYNRHGVYPKDIELPQSDGSLSHARVYPDIIVHLPGVDESNLLVIEVKKTTNQLPDDLDVAKLGQIKQQIGYQFAVFIRLATGENASLAEVRFTWV